MNNIVNYKTAAEVFDKLNSAEVNYLVLRNYENLLDPQIYVGGHGDIDMLCEDSQEVVKALGASFYGKEDGTHYYIFINGERAYLDLRHIGDDYYCEKWERDLLKNKVSHECFYVMNKEDYFYTLIFHAILQKKMFSEEYRNRLTDMANALGIDAGNCQEKDFLRILMDYMKENGYVFRYSKDPMIPQRYHLVDNRMIDRDWKVYWSHIWFSVRLVYWRLKASIKK